MFQPGNNNENLSLLVLQFCFVIPVNTSVHQSHGLKTYEQYLYVVWPVKKTSTLSAVKCHVFMYVLVNE